jgi:hypothetical protein
MEGVMIGRTLKLHGIPDVLMRRAKAIAAMKRMSMRAFVIECLGKGVECGWISTKDELQKITPPFLVPHRVGNGWKCSRVDCAWESKRPPGRMIKSVRILFDQDAETSFSNHVDECPVRRTA